MIASKTSHVCVAGTLKWSGGQYPQSTLRKQALRFCPLFLCVWWEQEKVVYTFNCQLLEINICAITSSCEGSRVVLTDMEALTNANEVRKSSPPKHAERNTVKKYMWRS